MLCNIIEILYIEEMNRENINIAWGVTGSGTFLRETFEVFKRIKRDFNVRITTFLSKAAEEVVRIYGLKDALDVVSPGGYYQEVITEVNAGVSCVYSGRFTLGRYKALFIAPATSNTVAKIICGISDTVVTTIVSQAIKGAVPVYILPSDVSEETTIPCYIDRRSCIGCMECIDVCPYKAISLVESLPRINLLKCYGCRVCEEICPVNAISCFEKAKIKIRDVDRENINKLKTLDGITVIEKPSSILKIVGNIVLNRSL